ncbi:hypothetical protein H257_11080 [Aphanomyces astaci]|uniref:Retrovirus-related Pol polyprotein from transposon TNT 1-94-like beta-barrel domain-containing protein n=1 Tax=Aphanomyces astaci TaxID=112090 RepID=W4G365_APHAT|nr:hypothetical protein H257_11080 [Aphanomyces astaci]ETV74115.1 hypothetical protein H257_11080 [Aphanomyces astaci]|eukprot:XP_009836221.1 hypothetical protein H257_11080 [Aphanomyces astaci]
MFPPLYQNPFQDVTCTTHPPFYPRPEDISDSSHAAIEIAANTTASDNNDSMIHQIIVDSGASSHMTGMPHQLHDTQPCERRAVVANRKSTTATTMGKMRIKTPQGKTFTLSNVLVINGMPMTPP